MSGRFAAAGSIGGPGPIGRAYRVLNGLATLAVLVWIVLSYEAFLGPDGIGPLAAVLIGLGGVASFLNFSELVNVGFTRQWGARPQLVLAALVLAVLAFDLLRYGHAWALPLGVALYVFLVYDWAHVGLSYLVAGVAGLPG